MLFGGNVTLLRKSFFLISSALSSRRYLPLAVVILLLRGVSGDAQSTIRAWGDNSQGELGDGTFLGRTAPVCVGMAQVIALTGGSTHNLALQADGTIRAWGGGGSALGTDPTTNRTTPAQTLGLNGVVAIARGGAHSLAITSDGALWAWGNNQYGQLGDGTYI